MTYSYTWLNNMLTYPYTVLWILYTRFAVCKQGLQIIITILVSEPNIWAKIWVSLNRDDKNGTIHISMMKNWVSHVYFFLVKGGLSCIAEKEVIRHSIFRKMNYEEIWQFIRDTCLFTSGDMGYLVPPIQVSFMICFMRNMKPVTLQFSYFARAHMYLRHVLNNLYHTSN